MAQLPQNFNAAQIAPQGNSQQFPVSPPEGWPVVIVASEMKPVKDKPNCGYLDLTLQIIEGEHTGQQGPYRLNLFSDNEKAVEIAYRQLSAIAHVTGVMNAVDSAQYHNIPFRAVVGLQKKKTADDPDYTQVNGVKHIDGNEPGKGSASSNAAPAPPAPPQQAPQAPVQPAAPQQAAPAWGGAPAAAQAAPAAPAWGGAPAAAAPAQAQPAWAAPQPAAAAGAQNPPWGAK